MFCHPIRPFLPLMIAFALLVAVPVGWAHAPAPPTATISGYVRDHERGTPVARAQVTVGTVSFTTDDQGRIPATTIRLAGPSHELDIVVIAPGYAHWTFERFAFRAGVPVELQVRLRQASSMPGPPKGPSPEGPREAPAQPQATNPATHFIPPDYIRVGRTYRKDCYVPDPAAPIPVETIRFQDYVRNVLPNEWIASWPAASLDAGAVAVKQFGWYTAFIQNKWSGQGYPFDVLDNTCDQVYQPGTAVDATDAAVLRTWSVTLIKDRRLFPTYYRAYASQCPEVPGCMGQHESAYYAASGWTARQILEYFYSPALYHDASLTPRAYLPLAMR